MRNRPRNLYDIAPWLDSDEIPFTCFMIGLGGGRLDLHVPHGQVDAVIAHFDGHRPGTL